MIAVELEVMAKKLDRFGWDRDRGTAAHDRIMRDWMDALQDFPLEEVQEACRRHLVENPAKVPHEGHIMRHLRVIRREKAEVFRSASGARQEQPEREPAMTPERHLEVCREMGLQMNSRGYVLGLGGVKRFGGGD